MYSFRFFGSEVVFSLTAMVLSGLCRCYTTCPLAFTRPAKRVCDVCHCLPVTCADWFTLVVSTRTGNAVTSMLIVTIGVCGSETTSTAQTVSLGSVHCSTLSADQSLYDVILLACRQCRPTSCAFLANVNSCELSIGTKLGDLE